MDLQVFMRDAEQTNNWVTKQEVRGVGVRGDGRWEVREVGGEGRWEVREGGR